MIVYCPGCKGFRLTKNCRSRHRRLILSRRTCKSTTTSSFNLSSVAYMPICDNWNQIDHIQGLNQDILYASRLCSTNLGQTIPTPTYLPPHRPAKTSPLQHNKHPTSPGCYNPEIDHEVRDMQTRLVAQQLHRHLPPQELFMATGRLAQWQRVALLSTTDIPRPRLRVRVPC